MPERWKAVHFVGVGGSGMSPLAEILLRRGMRVSGSDLKASSVTAYLESLGLEFHEGHAAAHVGAVDVVVRSSAVRPSNPEIAGSRAPRHPGDSARRVARRADGVEAGRRRGRRARQDDDDRDARSGARSRRTRSDGRDRRAASRRSAAMRASAAARLLVAEADESDRSFLWLRPHVAIVTNIDHEHLESYGTFDDLTQAFARFAESVPNEGAAVLCVDDRTRDGAGGDDRRSRRLLRDRRSPTPRLAPPT